MQKKKRRAKRAAGSAATAGLPGAPHPGVPGQPHPGVPGQPHPGVPGAPHPGVVGIGASAGGLAALKEFFRHVPEKSGLAWVVVVHLSPDSRSHLAELLQPTVGLPVRQVTETVKIEADQVYVIPPNANLEAIDTHLRLTKLEERQRARAPIDHFFRTLAATHDGAAVGVVLSGTGSDGTLGIREIKEKGGLTVAQDPSEAEYDAMPSSAMATGMIDLVLPVAAIPPAILRYMQTEPRVPVPSDDESLEAAERRLIAAVFAQIRSRTGRDFTRYKPSTIMRRIARRMQLASIEDLEDYLDLLRSRPEEVTALADELLITVTSFFRDPEVFEALRHKVLPGLFQRLGSEETLRAWSVGCATGEEAYSIAMLLLQGAGALEDDHPIQVFASDLQQVALEHAREGLYVGDVESDVPPEELERFFQKENGGYRVRKAVRETVLFAPHNLLGDPPFSRLDLIVCRNVLIYLQRDVQQEVVELFHYALKPDGILVLGTAERVEAADLFHTVDRKSSIYRRRSVPSVEPRLPVFPILIGRQERGRATATAAEPPSTYGQLHESMLERFAPPSIVVSADDKVVHFSNRAGRYLGHPGGALTSSVYRLLREELRVELRSALEAARAREAPVRTAPISMRLDGASVTVTLDVRPSGEEDQEGYALVIFDERVEAPSAVGSPTRGADGAEDLGSAHVAQLERERDTARERLQALIEEYDASREEMRASNEELHSTNEELRSTLEELETSKEELQSMNEELQTVNQENRHKMEELAQLSSDLQNLLSATDIATLFLDRELRILRFTPSVEGIFNVRATDRGRPLADLTHRLKDSRLLTDARQVLDTLVPVEREVEHQDTRWYLSRVLPYRSLEDRIEGVVITLVDVTPRKRAHRDLLAAQAELREELATSRALHTMMVRAFETNDTEDLLRSVLRTAVTLAGARAGSLQVLGQDHTLALVAQHGLPPAFVRGLEEVRADDDSVCARALREGKAVRVEDVARDPDYASLHQVFAEAGIRAVQSIPLVGLDGTVLGMLSTHFEAPRSFAERDTRVFDVVARHAADVIERRRAQEALERLAETLEDRVRERTREVRQLASTLTMAEQEERRRISQILHDDLQQLLYGIQMRLTMAREQAEAGDTQSLVVQTDRSLEQLKEAVTRTRRLTVDLSPPVLRGEGFVDALQWIRTQMRENYAMEVVIRAEPDLRVEPRELRVLLFHVVREALFNVAKHAETNRAVVDVRRGPDRLEVVVTDEGAGFDPARLEEAGTPLEGGFGIVSSRERIRLHGGDLQIDSAPGEGTRVTIYAPVTASS